MCTQLIIIAATSGINYSECLKYAMAELKHVLQLKLEELPVQKAPPKLKIRLNGLLGKGFAVFGFTFHLMSKASSS